MRKSLLLAIIAASIAAGPAAAGVRYKLKDLGTLGGYSTGRGVNASGQVTGYAETSSSPPSLHAFFYDGSAMIDIGTLGGTDPFGRSFSYGVGINASGQITGSSLTNSYSYHAFLYDSGVMTDLGTLGGSESRGIGINASGALTGNSDIAGNAANHAFIYDHGAMTDIGTLGGTNSSGQGINASGLVAGFSNTPGNAATHAFRYDGGVMTDLGTLGGTNSYGLGINASGKVTGSSYLTGDTAYHAFIYDHGVMTDLGTLGGRNSSAFSINASGQVVGNLDIVGGGGSSRGFLWTSGNMFDLNDLIDPSSGWFITEAMSINNRGQIAGSGRMGGGYHALLLTPVPEPSSWLMMILGFGMLGVALRRRMHMALVAA